MSATKETAAAWVRSVAALHLASNCRQYSWSTYVGQRSSSSAFGFQVDLKPAEGKVVDSNDDFVLVKTSRTEFFVAAKDVLATVPAIGETCRITPYSRRLWNGKRLDAPVKTDIGDGIISQTFHLGEYKSLLPIDKTSITCPEFRDMIDVIERERADEVRTVVQVLIDAGANQAPVLFQDVLNDEDIIDKPPLLRFKVATAKHVGHVEVSYDRACDSFTVSILKDDMSVASRTTDVFIAVEGPSEIGKLIIDAIDDGTWKIASVETLKKAPRTKALSA
jgi:hypothetical protein